MNQLPTPFIKVCGLTSIGHLRAAEGCGAEYVGLITEVPRSPRNLQRAQAALLARAAKAKPVMVTTSADADEIRELASSVQPRAVQLHGREFLVDAVRQRLEGVEVWQVVSVEVNAREPDTAKLAAEIEVAAQAGADKIMLDSARAGKAGGTGVAMDWSVAARAVELAGPTPVILAGGLDPGNVSEAIQAVRPAGVDVSSGVEVAPNAKSPALIRSFFQAVRLVTNGPNST